MKKEALTVKGGFYTAVTIQIDLLESVIIDERHFGTDEEAKAYQKEQEEKHGEGYHCFYKFVA